MDTTRMERQSPRAAHGWWRALAALLALAPAVGCKAPFLSRDPVPLLAPAEQVAFRPASLHVHQGICLAKPFNGAQAEAWLTEAARAEAVKDARCVDLYYRAAIVAWQTLNAMPFTSADDAAEAAEQNAARRVYKRALVKLILSGQVCGRLDPRGRLAVLDGGRLQVIPVVHHGFAWRPDEFCQLLSADGFSAVEDAKLANYYRMEGFGTALLALRVGAEEQPYYAEKHPFSATAVLQVREIEGRRAVVLDLFNPRVCDRCSLGGVDVMLARDLTAPFVYMKKAAPRTYLEGFLAPLDTESKPKLTLLEPYQRGKIPVVLIHGLLSDPTTWLDATNDLMAKDEIAGRFQFWGFRYPTGANLLGSAAALREQLTEARSAFDPEGGDPALDQMVLIGHSMGGLMAKLQVTRSADTLWRKAAHRPFNDVVATPDACRELRRDFFFEPAPFITRVVFVGTPHQGSNWTRRAIGRISSQLVKVSREEEDAYRRLMDDNRHIFYSYLWKSRPTSLDLLEPASEQLSGINALCYGHVTLHSIYGTGGMCENGEPGDGVVPVTSARLGGVASELSLPLRHMELHHAMATVEEFTRILCEHAANVHMQPAQ